MGEQKNPHDSLPLSQDEKLRIHAEEVYRHEVKTSFESEGEAQSRKDKLWVFLNSAFGLWLLSTCVVGGVTYLYTRHQQAEQNIIEVARENERKEVERKQNEIEQARRNASLITVLLPHLASQEDKPSRLAIAVTRFLKERGELPGELESVLVEIVKGNNLPNTSPNDQAKVTAAAAVIDIPQKSELENRADLTSLPPRVYLQIPGESQRPMAQSLQSKLRANGFIVPGIENIGGKANIPSHTEVRYYRDEEKGEASRLITILKEAGVQVNDVPQKIPGSGKGTRPRHYELWISNS